MRLVTSERQRRRPESEWIRLLCCPKGEGEPAAAELEFRREGGLQTALFSFATQGAPDRSFHATVSAASPSLLPQITALPFVTPTVVLPQMTALAHVPG